MKNFDIKSLCIGFLSASLIFMLMGAKEKKNLGDIVVNSITVLDDGYGGFITAYIKIENALYIWAREKKIMDTFKPLINSNSQRRMSEPIKIWMGYLF